MGESRQGYQLAADVDLLESLSLNPALKMYAGNFLLYGGVLAGHSDGNLAAEEVDYLTESLAPLFVDPRLLIDSITSPHVAVASLEESMAWLKDHAGPVCLDLLRCLCGIVASDGVLEGDERKFIQNVAVGLGIPPNTTNEILENAFL